MRTKRAFSKLCVLSCGLLMLVTQPLHASIFKITHDDNILGKRGSNFLTNGGFSEATVLQGGQDYAGNGDQLNNYNDGDKLTLDAGGNLKINGVTPGNDINDAPPYAPLMWSGSGVLNTSGDSKNGFTPDIGLDGWKQNSAVGSYSEWGPLEVQGAPSAPDGNTALYFGNYDVNLESDVYAAPSASPAGIPGQSVGARLNAQEGTVEFYKSDGNGGTTKTTTPGFVRDSSEQANYHDQPLSGRKTGNTAGEGKPTWGSTVEGVSTPVSLWQTFDGLTVGETYMLDFWVSGEHDQAFDLDGLFRTEILTHSMDGAATHEEMMGELMSEQLYENLAVADGSGEGYSTVRETLFLISPGLDNEHSFDAGDPQSERYHIWFEADSDTITLAFTSWGHAGLGQLQTSYDGGVNWVWDPVTDSNSRGGGYGRTELVLDDVILSVPVQTVPLPATVWLFAGGLAMFGVTCRRRARKT
ncbi:MAG: VPLPA-CTERM sorting domain-containing protein [Sedimenticola sp.]